MTPDEAREVVRDALVEIAPDADISTLAPADDLREGLDLDSLDFQAFTAALARRTGAELDEDEARLLTTMEACVHFVVTARSGVP